MDIEGRLLGNRYEILEKIGNGGMAMVYKAKDQVLNRYIAVKILRDEFTTDTEFIKRFEAEAQSAASITHPNIVSVYDVGNEGNLYYIVMELVQGKTLKEIIVEEGAALPWKWSLNIAIQIASALEVAHRNKIVHRDIKPHNIIITEDGIAKVTDFGIAKAVSNSTITAFGTTIGSVHYFSPEHARGGFTDAKSDLYSLGIVMYEMLTGRVPFDADTPVSVALKHMQEEPIPPKEINDKIPDSVNDIILKAMRKDTSLRYQSATEMLRDLKRALKDPEGNFVDNKEYAQDMSTQKVSVKEIQEEERRTSVKKENKFIQFIKNHKILVIIISLILVFAISLVGTVTVSRMTEPKEVILPKLVGENIEKAKQIAQTSNLIIEVSSEEYNSQYEAGKIISQDPAYIENYKIKMGTTIKVVVSKGVEQTVVPKVIDMTLEEATKTLTDAKLKVQTVEEENKKIEVGHVISQETEPDTKVLAGDTVVIHISTGVKKIAIPNVIEKTEEEAKKTLTDLGLNVTVNYDEDASKDNGVVLKQSLDVGKEVEEGASMSLTINKITETKSATVTIRLDSILKDRIQYEEVEVEEEKDEKQEKNKENDNNANTSTTSSTTKKTKKVAKKVKVTLKVGEENYITDESYDPTATIVKTIYGVGTVKVTLYINGNIEKKLDVNLNNTNKVVFD